MMIKCIALENCGAYAGRHEIDLSADDNRPIVLVGGLNGGGKTTLFEAVLLCLYGMRYAKTTRKAYEKRLIQLMHRQRSGGLAGAEEWSSVAVRLMLHRNSRVEEYEVERRWRRSKDGAAEEMRVCMPGRDDTGLDMMGQDQMQAFVNGLVPRGMADLFFFDGEMIYQMAESGESAAIRQSFNSLLGLDTVEQLQSDLRTNLARSMTGGDRHLQEEFSNLNAEKEHTESDVTHLRERLIGKESDLARVRAGIEDAEARLDMVGGSYARNYQDAKARLEANKTKMEMIGRRIAESCSGELPFGLLPREMDGVGMQMGLDRAASQRMVEYETVQRTIERIKSAIESAGSIGGETSARVMAAVDGVLPDSPPEAQKEVFGFSVTQQEQIARVIDSASGEALEAAGSDAQEYARVREEADRMEDAVNRTPTDDEVGPIVSGIKKMYGEAGGLEAEIDHLEKEISAGEAMIKLVSSKIRGVLDGQYKNKKTQRMAELTGAVQKALDMYAERLRKEKMGLLESHIIEVTGMLMHKDMIKSVSIDTDTFEMRLRDAAGEVIPRESLSKGEQQMLATSVLWALARTSGRPLPFMIDTPLARLDQSHRFSLVEQFFPQASHQMLILSTDTEIGREEHSRLLPYISRSYTVRYDPESGSTRVRDGYFWDGDGNGIQ